MTEEEKKVEECKVENRECKCQKILTKFLLDTVSVFLGVLLALLVLRGLTAPKFPVCPCGMRGGYPMMERQIPPHRIGHKNFHKMRMYKGQPPRFEKKSDFKKFPPRPDFETQAPQKIK